MTASKHTALIPLERVERKILLIRGQKVLLDSDLADLYGVTTKRLNEQVRRNADRFPKHFMFQLTKQELEDWRSQIATSNPNAKMGLRRPPYAFTEHGTLQAANVLSKVSLCRHSRVSGNLGDRNILRRRRGALDRRWHGDDADIWTISCRIGFTKDEDSPKTRLRKKA